MFGVDTEISIFDMRKPETEYDEMMRRSKKIISQLLSAIITLNLGTAHYHKGK